jgi:hypothetical protein
MVSLLNHLLYQLLSGRGWFVSVETQIAGSTRPLDYILSIRSDSHQFDGSTMLTTFGSSAGLSTPGGSPFLVALGLHLILQEIPSFSLPFLAKKLSLKKIFSNDQLL